MNAPAEPARFTDASHALAAILAGKARFTLVSTKSGARYTYEVGAPKEGAGSIWFARLLTGSDNQNDYTYMGAIRPQGKDMRVRVGGKSAYKQDALPVVALDFALVKLGRGEMPAGLEVWHEGRCCRCGRALTVPESVATGLGPVCSGKDA